jgi:hypothetical protein
VLVHQTMGHANLRGASLLILAGFALSAGACDGYRVAYTGSVCAALDASAPDAPDDGGAQE